MGSYLSTPQFIDPEDPVDPITKRYVDNELKKLSPCVDDNYDLYPKMWRYRVNYTSRT